MNRSRLVNLTLTLVITLAAAGCEEPQPVWQPGSGAADARGPGPTLAWDGERFSLDGEAVSSFGLRAANALQSDEITDRLVESLPSMREHGIQALAISLQGGRFEEGGNSNMNAYTSRGELRLEYAERLARLLDASAEHRVVPVIMFFYRGRDDELRNEAAVLGAVEATTRFLMPWRHAWFHVINEWHHPGFDHAVLTEPEGHRRIYDAIKALDGDRIVHVSDAEGAHDGLRSDTGLREDMGGVVVEYTRQDTYTEPGVFDQGAVPYEGRGRTAAGILEDAEATLRDGGYWFWHAAWHQKADEPGWPRWDAGGEGTTDDPGVSFVWRWMRANSMETARDRRPGTDPGA